jgi:hypothetical protein
MRSTGGRQRGLFLAVLAAGCLFALDALARAGGGEHYSGRSSSGGSGGGDGIPIELVWMLVRLTFAYPHVMVPAWIVVFVVGWMMKRSTAYSTTQRGFAHLEE